jgi:hypothetical protein
MMITLDIARQRLQNQHIARPTFEKPSDVVAWMGAMQAQDYTGAKRSIGLRLCKATDADIEQAIADKTIVRTWPMRGTLHFVAAADVRWMLALLAPGIIAGNARRYRELELDEDTLAHSNTLLVSALQRGKQLKRTELLALLEQNGISTRGQRAPYLLQRACLHSLICQGVTERNNPAYMAIDDSLPKSRTMGRDEALAELAKRYFTSHGPAALRDFAAWSGLSAADACAGLEAVQAQLVHETIDGQTYWLPQSTPAVNHSSPTLYLLPGFDEYLLGYRDRSAVLDSQHANKVVPGGNGMFMPTIVIDGRVAGIWKRTFKKGAIIVTADPFTAFTAAESQAFAAAAHCYGEYLRMPVTLPQA